jgi:hypothetical protein
VARKPARPPAPGRSSATAAPGVHIVHRDGVYTTESFRRAFGLRTSSLRREVREGRLKVYKRCGKYFILGEDILAWLRAGEARRPSGSRNGDAGRTDERPGVPS